MNSNVNGLGTSDAVCFTDSGSPDMTLSTSTYYTCFQRPTPTVLNTILGYKEEIDAVGGDDPQPDLGQGTIRANCAAYNGGYKTIMSGYTRVSTLTGTVSSIGLGNISSGMGILRSLSTATCASVAANDTAKTNICNSLKAGIERYSTLLTDTTTPTSLQNLYTTLRDSKATMSNEIFGMLKPGFLNSGCISPQDLSNYSQAF
jgi:hypothetical protein